MSRETRNAWNSAGVTIIRRSADDSSAIVKTIRLHNGRGLINAGNLHTDLSNIGVPVFNSHDSIRSVSTATALRRTLGDYLPSDSLTGPHWHKSRGFRGDGKVFHTTRSAYCLSVGGDVQQHVDGVEFRVNTVGSVIVQAHKKLLTDTIGNFIWEWCGVDGIRANGIIPLIKEAANSIPNFEHTVFGWDIIVGSDGPRVIEINTSPGVNEPTARRIAGQIRKVI